jgi:SnoaL-like protein
MESKAEAKEVVLSYIRALDRQEYDAAQGYLLDGIRIKGPAGESFGKPKEFIDMLRMYRGKYDVKKVFADGDDVCLLYNLATPAATIFMCSWYQVKDGKIVSIQTVFDPRPFGPPPGRNDSAGQVR